MDDIAEFLRARWDEDEVTAKAASAPSPWKAATHESDSWIVTDAAGEPLIYDEGTPSLAEAAHIARHDPARVLREVEAKRAILRDHGASDRLEYGDPLCMRCSDLYPCDVLHHLVSVYSDHPDYRTPGAPS